MKKHISKQLQLVTMVIALFLVSSTVFGQSKSTGKIIKPSEGEKVNIGYRVTGEAELATNEELWIVVAIEGFAKRGHWYLQGNPTVRNGAWSEGVNFGKDIDTGEYFMVMAITVSSKGDHAKLTQLIDEMTSSGNWKPIKLETEISDFKILDKKEVLRQ